jgi:predicted DNA-binding transcriptional regulator AlpA
MAANIVTTEDLEQFKTVLLEEIKMMLQNLPIKKSEHYLRSAEVIDRLKVSPSKLYAWRQNGTLPFSKVEGIIYYKESDIDKLMEDGLQSQKLRL